MAELKESQNNIESKHKKEIDNLKLMHAQQLYILKKKEKKN